MNAPHNPLAPSATVEKAVLGALLLSDSAYWSVESVLKPEHFSFAIHSKIFSAIKKLCDEGKKVSLQKLVALIGEEYDDGKSVIMLLGALLNDAERSEGGGVWQTFVEDIIEGWRKRQIKEQVEWATKRVVEAGVNSDDLITDLKGRLEAIEANSQAQRVQWIGEIAAKAARSGKAARDGGVVPGFDTGLSSLDEVIGRIHQGDFGAIIAPQGDGKTILAAQLAKRAALYGPVAFDQLDMGSDDMVRRELAQQSDMSAEELEEGAFDFFAAERLDAAVKAMANLPIIIDDRTNQSIDQIISRARSLKRSHGIHAMFIDHMRKVQVRGKMHDRFEKYPIITGGLKDAGKDIGVTFVLLSQVLQQAQRRDSPVLQLTDAEGGGSLQQDADWVIGMWRWDRWLKTREPTNGSEADWSKWREKYNRHKGRVEMCGLKRRRGQDGIIREFEFNGRLSVIREIEK
ncbi:replicative DNA helicase [Pleomorphomonas sp. PLEO]|uniref:replicative DNA helicase n=1 Tax=Pleomorphomonas sp. PLEO TaxID=3239306 RepID=UPI00351F3158